jgi:hypothetical protein
VTEFNDFSFSQQPYQVGSIIWVWMSELDVEDKLVSETLVNCLMMLSAQEDFTVLKIRKL